MDYPTWRDNPQYFLTMEQSAKLQITLDQDSEALDQVGFYVMNGYSHRTIVSRASDIIAQTDFSAQRSGTQTLTHSPSFPLFNL